MKLYEVTFKFKFIKNLIAENYRLKKIERNFKESAYKNILRYEEQNETIKELEEQLKLAKEQNIEIKKANRTKTTVTRLKKGAL